MMYISTIINSCCYVLLVLFITSTCAYVIESDDLKNSLSEQQLGLNFPSYYDRFIRSTKFPRIGRSPSDMEEISFLYDANTSANNEENEANNNNENELKWFEQRSVLFPRIGKRAYHDLLRENSFSNPHRMLDAQGRYHINGYDYRLHENHPPSVAPYRGKRNLSM